MCFMSATYHQHVIIMHESAHVSIISSYIVNTISVILFIYCTNTYLCSAIARALMSLVIFYIHDYKYNNMCYVMFMLCHLSGSVQY